MMLQCVIVSVLEYVMVCDVRMCNGVRCQNI